jgi:S-sulfo-L-cysteine synthase (3-phospho-L-serine-dependent)
MTCRRISATITDAIELPHIVRLTENLHAAAFSLMKLLPARFILDRARNAGLLEPKSVIIETTSGTFGLALAMLCALRNYKLILISDPAIDDTLKRRLEYLKARVEIVTQPAEVGGFQGARLQRMAEIRAEHPNHFWPSQYDNPDNPGAYAPAAELLVETLGEIDCIVGAVGSGGSVCGTAAYLRVIYPNATVIGVDTPGSVLFGQPDRKRMLRGLGNSLMPKNVDHTAFDEVHWVDAAEAFLATKELYKTHALFQGGTSGAAFLVADWWARQNPRAKVVVLLPDDGYRYQDTIYNDDWLRRNQLWLDQLPESPKLVSHPLDAGPGWSCINWNRRSYEEILEKTFVGQAV